MSETKISRGLKLFLLYGNIVLSILLILGILTCLEIIGFNHNHAVDFTPEKKYTLSDQAKKVLDSLEDTVSLKTFYRTEEKEGYYVFYEKLAAYSSKIDYQLIDLDRNPGQARMYKANISGYTVVEYKGKTHIINPPTEETVINSILRISSENPKNFYILKGHGKGKDFYKLKDTLTIENWQLKEIDITELKVDAGDHNSVLMVADPEMDLSQTEIGILEKYLNSGGKAVILLEPFVKLPNLTAFLENVGLLLPEGIIIDYKNTLFGGDYLAPLISNYAKAPVTSQVPMSSFFQTARPVEIKRVTNRNGPYVMTIASSEKQSWMKMNREDIMKGDIDFIEGVDKPGPISVAAMVTMPKKADSPDSKTWELICFGDSDFITDNFIEIMGNQDLFLNAVEWLARDYELVSIRQKRYRYPYHFLEHWEGRILFSVPVIVLPLMFLLTAIILFIFRRIRG